LLTAGLGPLGFRNAELLDPLVQAVLGNSQPGGYVSRRITPLRDLLDGLDLELVRVTLAAQDTSLMASILRLRGVNQSRGDSSILVAPRFKIISERQLF